MKNLFDFFSLKGLDSFEIFVQLIGYLGVVANVICFQCKRHRNVMIFKTSNEFFFGIQYILLGAFSGATMNFIGSARNIIFTVCVEKKKSTLYFQIAFSIFFVVSGILSWEGYLSLLIVFAKVLTTVIYGIKNTRVLRILTIPSSCCWLYYNYVSNSAAGVICEIFTLTSLAIAITRLDIVPMFQKKNHCLPADAEGKEVKES